MDIQSLISVKRRRPSRVEESRGVVEQLASDRSRIVYSAPFRRLTKKAQVFSLESNAAVRNRITHSLEVSDIGRLISYQVTEELIRRKRLPREFQLPIIYAVENACLLHDIGNPPFGHFGEAAISDWFRQHWESYYAVSRRKKIKPSKRMTALMQDFIQFDGNPQGLRIILRLRRDVDQFGLNLTYTSILSSIKYVRAPSEPKWDPLTKKPGYFETEKKIVLKIKTELGLAENARYALAYIMEAADDIAYCVSDIEDGIEKGILTDTEFFSELRREWGNTRFPFYPQRARGKGKVDFFEFKTYYARHAVKEASNTFVRNLDELLAGRAPNLLREESQAGEAIECLKRVARQRLFRSPQAENPELAGYQIVTGLLDKLGLLLLCSEEEFMKLLQARIEPGSQNPRGLDYQFRLVNKLPLKHVGAYQDQLQEFESKDFPEWYLRAHLMVDFISGMTDGFALEFYQLLDGIRLAQEW
ncbi:MAG TPA: dGTPase [Pyrinomonadaceae bacterium]|jgi:dGTPase|nr:dGTPase [Pyrinomonadaceae bacterium]